MKLLLLTALSAVAMFAADATGTWLGSFTPTGDDNNPRPAHLILKQEGTKLTGSGGPNAGEQHPIQNGKAEDGVVTFEIVAGSGVMRFNLKQEGDEIKGEMSRERDGGEKQMAVLTVKREK